LCSAGGRGGERPRGGPLSNRTGGIAHPDGRGAPAKGRINYLGGAFVVYGVLPHFPCVHAAGGYLLLASPRTSEAAFGGAQSPGPPRT